VVAPLGTGATIEVAFQLVGVAVVPLNVTVLVPWVEPKFVPVIVTDVPTGPDVGDKLVMLETDPPVTVKVTPLLRIPLKVLTTMFPVVAPAGTVTVKVLLQLLVTVPGVPLKNTVPAVLRKFVPVTVTDIPTGPEAGETLVIFGPGKKIPLLATPFTVTTTLPSVAPVGSAATIDVLLQLVGLAVVVLNFTVLVPCVVPKLFPAMVTTVPIVPYEGVRLVITGAEPEVTVNDTGLLT